MNRRMPFTVRSLSKLHRQSWCVWLSSADPEASIGTCDQKGFDGGCVLFKGTVGGCYIVRVQEEAMLSRHALQQVAERVVEQDR